MRLWHKDLIPVLPRTQLIAQWRELNCIFSKQPNHILINYVYNYPKGVLKHYADLVVEEFNCRGYKINKWDNYNKYFDGVDEINENFKEHDILYLTMCKYNLYEKYLRGQKDFTGDIWDNIFYKEYNS